MQGESLLYMSDIQGDLKSQISWKGELDLSLFFSI